MISFREFPFAIHTDDANKVNNQPTAPDMNILPTAAQTAYGDYTE